MFSLSITGNVEQIVAASKCTGCMACHNACLRRAIEMAKDRDGFLVPQVNASLCDDCGACLHACPTHSFASPNVDQPQAFAFKASAAIRQESSSGGFFAVASAKILNNGGCVAGVVWDRNFQAKYVLSGAWADIERMRGSKYMQANPGYIYREVKNALKASQKVLFVGLPCQVAGLRAYLRKPYENLLAIDLICFGAPSNQIFQKYLSECHAGREIQRISFRDKIYKWGTRVIKITYGDGTFYEGREHNDPYLRAYYANLINRKSCYICKFCAFPRYGDLSMGDFWDCENHIDWNDTDLGISLVYANNQKGVNFLKSISNKECMLQHIDKTEQIRNRLSADNAPHAMRSRFFKLLGDSKFGKAVDYALNDQYDIACIGYFQNSNFGGALTYYALYKFLCDCGYSVLMVGPPFAGQNINTLIDSIYERGSYPVYDLAPVFPNKNAMRCLNEKCNIFITGSDQQFNHPFYNYLHRYVVQDWVRSDKNQIAYAASFGHGQLSSPKDEALEMRFFIKRFDAFSVREASAEEICKREFGITPKQVLDPVFIVDKRRLIDLAKLATANTDATSQYVYAYVLDPNPEKEKIIVDMLDHTKISYKLYTDWNVVSGFDLHIEQASMNKRLRDLIEAEYVFTDSYHGVCLAIIFEKPFIAWGNLVRGIDRFETILEITGLKERMIYSYTNYIQKRSLLATPIDYRAVMTRLQPMIEGSRQWLLNALKSNQDKYLTDYDMYAERLASLECKYDRKISDIEAKYHHSMSLLSSVLLHITSHQHPEEITDPYIYLHYLLHNAQKLIIAIAVRDTPCGEHDNQIYQYLINMGLKTDLSVAFRCGYVALIAFGKVIVEQLFTNHSYVIETTTIKDHKINMYSAGYLSGNKAEILFDGIDYAVNDRGLNIVIINIENMSVIDSFCIDTFADPPSLSRK